MIYEQFLDITGIFYIVGITMTTKVLVLAFSGFMLDDNPFDIAQIFPSYEVCH